MLKRDWRIFQTSQNQMFNDGLMYNDPHLA